MSDLLGIAERFEPQGRVLDVREFGGGNINNTFLVTLDGATEKRFILQRLNTHVFHQPQLVMRNMRISTGHMHRRLESVTAGAGGPACRTGRRWEVPQVLLTKDGDDHCIDSAGSFWRAISFIEGARSFATIKNADHAREVGYALGMFHTLLIDLPPDSLSDTLEGFHVTPLYLRSYDDVLKKTKITEKSPDVKYCMEFVGRRRAWAHVLEDARAEGRLSDRIIHGDPKVDNVMIDDSSEQAVGIVDLDTIKPGLIHYDIGDCLRSGCNPVGEDTEQMESVRFETDLCRAVLDGYLSIARRFLTEDDFHYIYDSVRLIAFELGLRFFTDYLEGDVYFKVRRDKQNLARALMQFKLTESIESQEKVIRNIIRENHDNTPS